MKCVAAGANEKGLRLTYMPGPGVPEELFGDPIRLRQVLLNLVSNAVKFTPQGEVALRVSVEEVAAGRVGLHFQVRDTGVGIPPEKQVRLFQPFEQADASTSRQYGGTGLGLAISARLVELMDGRIWLESTPGSGSTFHFTARFDPVLQGQDPAPAPIAQVRPESSPAASQVRILLAEDHPVNQKLALAMLQRMGHEAELASTGAEAVRKWREGRFELILMDVQMPELDGLQATRLIRSEERSSGRHIPIVAMTSHAMSGDREVCLQAGMDDYISKPIHRQALEDAILRFSGAAHGCESVERSPD